MAEVEDPISLANRVVAMLDAHDEAFRDAGLHPHELRRQIETSLRAYRQAVAAKQAAAIAAAEHRLDRMAADVALRLAHAAIHLLKEEGSRAGEARPGDDEETP